ALEGGGLVREAGGGRDGDADRHGGPQALERQPVAGRGLTRPEPDAVLHAAETVRAGLSVQPEPGRGRTTARGASGREFPERPTSAAANRRSRAPRRGN